MRKIIVSAISFCFLLCSTASGSESISFNGLYIGGALNYSKGSLFTSGGNLPGSLTFSSRGLGANAFIGYGFIINESFYIGGELSSGIDGSHFKNKIYEDKGRQIRLKPDCKIKSRFTYNLSGRLGYIYYNFLAYTKFGFEGRSKIIIVENNANVSRSGLIVGAGGDYAINKNIFIRAEYHYNFGDKIILTRKRNNISLKTSTHTFLMGAAYKF